MDRGNNRNKFYGQTNSKMYLDLKDIIRENALPYLPAKSLFRCTGICRDWKLMISSPFFAHNQAYSFRSISGFFLQSEHKPPSFVSLDQMAYGVPDPSLSFLPEPVQVRSSSNGLVCCQGVTGDKPYYICNPVNKMWKKLPKPEANHGSDPAIVLIFKPSLLNFVAEYTLVCAFPSDLDGYEFEIYSSKNGTWRVSGEILFGNRKFLPNSGVHVNGVVYWMEHLGRKSMGFDLQAERVQFIPSDGGGLGEINGKLYSGRVNGSRLYVSELANAYTNTMQMNSRVSAWKQKFDVTLEIKSSSNRNVPVLFLNDDVAVIQDGESLYSYGLKTKILKTLSADFRQNMRLVPYVNGLMEI
ncbi:hypothetical protein ACFE04_002345 [Oxalis oulophora]